MHIICLGRFNEWQMLLVMHSALDQCFSNFSSSGKEDTHGNLKIMPHQTFFGVLCMCVYSDEKGIAQINNSHLRQLLWE